MQYKGAIFDMDGTLLDSMYVWKNLAERFLESKGVVPPESLRKDLEGVTLEDAAEVFSSKYGLSEAPAVLLAQMEEMVANAYFHEVQLKPYAADFLNHLKKQGIKLCLLTATGLHLTVPALKRVGIYSLFDVVTSCGELGMTKRSGDIYKKAASLLELTPSETVVFEDAEHAVRSAKNAGFYVAAMEDEAQSHRAPVIKALADTYWENWKKAMDMF